MKKISKSKKNVIIVLSCVLLCFILLCTLVYPVGGIKVHADTANDYENLLDISVIEVDKTIYLDGTESYINITRRTLSGFSGKYDRNTADGSMFFSKPIITLTGGDYNLTFNLTTSIENREFGFTLVSADWSYQFNADSGATDLVDGVNYLSVSIPQGETVDFCVILIVDSANDNGTYNNLDFSIDKVQIVKGLERKTFKLYQPYYEQLLEQNFTTKNWLGGFTPIANTTGNPDSVLGTCGCSGYVSTVVKGNTPVQGQNIFNQTGDKKYYLYIPKYLLNLCSETDCASGKFHTKMSFGAGKYVSGSHGMALDSICNYNSTLDPYEQTNPLYHKIDSEWTEIILPANTASISIEFYTNRADLVGKESVLKSMIGNVFLLEEKSPFVDLIYQNGFDSAINNGINVGYNDGFIKGMEVGSIEATESWNNLLPSIFGGFGSFITEIGTVRIWNTDLITILGAIVGVLITFMVLKAVKG